MKVPQWPVPRDKRRRKLNRARATGTTVAETTYGKWLACDHDRFIGVMGDTEAEALANLQASQKRADEILKRVLIDKRMDEAPETEVGLGPEELEALAESEADLARGDFTVAST